MRSFLVTPRLLFVPAFLASAACAPNDQVFGEASSAGGGSSVSTGEGGASADGGGAPASTGEGGDGSGATGQGGDTTVGPGGAGGGDACETPDQCDDPPGECVIAACAGGSCGTAFVPAGTKAVEQDVGDCRQRVCDGQGDIEVVDDDGDVVDDGNACTIEACLGGELDVTFADEGTACGDGDALFCNDAGECTGCVVADQCPGVDDECQTRTCDGGTCGTDYRDPGTPVDDDAGNCVVLECDGAGNVEVVVDDGDVPVDGLECTRDLCNDGDPANPATNEGTPCSDGVCDGDGACVECTTDADCGDDTACAVFDCTNQNSCDVAYGDPGDFAGDPVPNDCRHDECGSQGAIVSDVPDDAGDACGGGSVCDGAGNCVECTVDGECASDICRCGTCVDDAWIFFSQYVEGSASNKALEIYNALGEPFDLGDFGCEIWRFQNGDADPAILPLTGTIPPGGTWVVCNTAATFALSCDQTGLTAMDFNGDDAVALACSGDIFDVIGEIGLDPGTQWGNGNTSTADNTLYRKPGIFVGDLDGGDAFVPADEWNGAPNDTIVGLGEHDPCGG